MAVLNPDHLLDQARKLMGPPLVGRPRQVDLRRAISAAYYALFHFVLTAAADEYVGATKQASTTYVLVYRSIHHRELRDVCIEVRKQQPATRYQRHAPSSGFGADLQAFAHAFIELQERRHSADYDPAFMVKTSDAALAVQTAQSAIHWFQRAGRSRQRAFLAILLFAPR